MFKGDLLKKFKEFLFPEEREIREIVELVELDDLVTDVQEIKKLLEGLARPTVPVEIEVPPVEVPPVKVELERPPLERPIRTFSQSNVEVGGTLEFFKVEGVGELIFFTVISLSENFRVKIVIDNSTPPSYDNKTYSEYTLTSGTDPHLTADDDVIESETIYKVTIKKLPFFRNVAGYVSTTEPVTFKVIEAQVAVG